MAAATPEQKAKWPAPNFENPESRSASVIGVTASSTALVIVLLGMRFYSRGILRQTLGRDDWVMLAAAVFSIPVSVMAMHSLNFGLGLHIWDQKKEWHEPYSKMAFSVDIVYPITCSLTKISLCLTYLRLFPSTTDRIFCWTLSTFVTLYTVACLFLMLFQCKPIRGYWDASIQFTCIDMRVTLIALAGMNSLSDFLVYLFPAKPLWSVQLPKKQRLGLILGFSVGCTVCVAGIARMYYLELYFETYDVLWVACPLYAVMIIEMNLGLICGCLSGVRPVLTVIFPRVFGTTDQTSTRRSTYGGNTGRSIEAETFPIQSLFDGTNSKSRDQEREHTIITKSALHPEDDEQSNLAWASSSGERAHPEVPSNAIAVQTVVMREEESVHSTPKGLDGGSEEWIMEEHPVPKNGKHVR